MYSTVQDPPDRNYMADIQHGAPHTLASIRYAVKLTSGGDAPSLYTKTTSRERPPKPAPAQEIRTVQP